MADAALRIERRDRLGAQILATRRPHRRHGNARIHLADDARHHVAALVDLGDQRIGLQRVIERHRRRRPALGLHLGDGRISQHIARAVLGETAADDPASIGAAPPARRRIDRHHDAGELRRRAEAEPLDHLAAPQRIGAIVDQFAVDLLPPEPRAAIAADDTLQESRREIAEIGRRAGARDHRALGLHQPLHERRRARRRGDQLSRQRAEPEPELQHVPARLLMAPFAELVRPGRLELRAAQAFRILGRKAQRHRAVRPFEPPARGLPLRPLAGGVHREEARDALDHHVADIGQRLADQRDAPDRPRGIARPPERQAADPFRPGARLAGAAPADHQPGEPVAGRRQLVVARPEIPV